MWALVMSNTSTSVIAVSFPFSKYARCEGEFGNGTYILCTNAHCHRRKLKNVTV
jgi:hypothetical protein